MYYGNIFHFGSCLIICCPCFSFIWREVCPVLSALWTDVYQRYSIFCFHHAFFVTCFGDLSLINTLCLGRCELEIFKILSHTCTICFLASGYLVCMCYSCIQFSQGKVWVLAFSVVCVYMFVSLLVLTHIQFLVYGQPKISYGFDPHPVPSKQTCKVSKCFQPPWGKKSLICCYSNFFYMNAHCFIIISSFEIWWNFWLLLAIRMPFLIVMVYKCYTDLVRNCRRFGLKISKRVMHV